METKLIMLSVTVVTLVVLMGGVSGTLSNAEMSVFASLYNATDGPAWTLQPSWGDLCSSSSSSSNTSFPSNSSSSPSSVLLLNCTQDQTAFNTIILSQNNLVGTIPTQIGLFSALTYLDLSNNAIYGTIPTQLQLLSLNNLYLTGNTFSCPLQNYSSWASFNDFSVANLLCTCPNAVFGPETYPTTSIGANATGSCASGYGGIPVRTCLPGPTSGVWSNSTVSGRCYPLLCRNRTIDNAFYPTVQAGTVSAGTCLTGYSGSPNRLCIQNGTSASFSSNITSGTPCNEITCPLQILDGAIFPQSKVFRTVVGNCPTGYTGNPSRSCLLVGGAGVWSTTVTGRRCIPNCPAAELFDASFQETPAGLSDQGNCLQGFVGFPVLQCLIQDNSSYWAFEVLGTPCKASESAASTSGKIAAGILGTIAGLAFAGTIALYISRRRTMGADEPFLPLDEIRSNLNRPA